MNTSSLCQHWSDCRSDGPSSNKLVGHHLPFRPAQTLLGRNDPKFVLPHLRNWGQRAVQHFFIPVHAFMVRWQRHLFYIHEFRPMKILSALDLFTTSQMLCL